VRREGKRSFREEQKKQNEKRAREAEKEVMIKEENSHKRGPPEENGRIIEKL
jgi:hypothetical protein